MRWWGKAAGGTVGFAVFGPVGALVGAVLGHEFDKGMSAELDAPRRPAGIYPFRETLLDASFSLMGHIARVDGRVSAAERQVVGEVISELELESHRKTAAWRAFDTGATREFRAETQLDRLKEISRGKPQLIRALLDMLMRVGLAEGGISGNTRVALKHIGRHLGVSGIEMAQTEAMARMRAGAGRAAEAMKTGDDPVIGAYAVLGIEADAADDAVKRAYRRLMNRHHPDKIAGQDPGEDALRAAREKTHEIRMAYETVMESRRH